MKRRLFTILSALSLLLFVAVVVLWVRSYFAEDRLHLLLAHDSGLIGREIVNCCGVVSYVWQSAPEKLRDMPKVRNMRRPSEEFVLVPGLRAFSYDLDEVRFLDSTEGTFLGFWVTSYDDDPANLWGGIPSFEVWVPHWALTLATAPLALRIPWRWYRERRRTAVGLCATCGYDLRATPGRCPECGLFPAAPPPHRHRLIDVESPLHFIFPSDFTEARRMQRRVLDVLTTRDYTEDQVFAIRQRLEAGLIEAIKYGNKHDRNKTVTVHVETAPDHVEIVIENQGTGNIRRLYFRT